VSGERVDERAIARMGTCVCEGGRLCACICMCIQPACAGTCGLK
jgi:hypothetical protein